MSVHNKGLSVITHPPCPPATGARGHAVDPKLEITSPRHFVTIERSDEIRLIVR